MVRSVAGAVVAVILGAYLAVSATEAFPYQAGADFYQFWGVPVAKQVSAAHDSPYVDAPGYAQALNAISDSSPSEKLRAANSYRRVLEPMGTPFLYAVFALFPQDYESAQAVFVTFLYLSAGLGVFVLVRMRGLGRWAALCTAFAVELTFAPFMVDVRAANVNSLQLAFIAVLIGVAAAPARRAWIEATLLGLLALFVVFKPNTLWIALALATCFGVSRGKKAFFRGVGVAAIFATAAIVTGVMYFSNANVWGEWLAAAREMNGSGLPLTLEQGNQSLAMLLARHSAIYGALGYGLILGALLAISVVAAMTSVGRRIDLLAPTAKRAFSSPWFAASLGVLFTFATSPLVWTHYFVLALIPIAWLAGRGGAMGLGTWGAMLCYLALSRIGIGLLVASGSAFLLYAVTLLSWVALIPGTLQFVVEQRRSVEAAS